MSNYTNIPLLSPFKFVKSAVRNIHFDGDFAVNNIKSFERSTCYFQKWNRADTTLLQITSTIQPNNLQVYKADGITVALSIPWTLKATPTMGVMVYECLIDFTTITTDGIYYLYISGQLMTNTYAFISEAINLRTTHSNTLLFTYYNSYNDFDTFFTTNYKASFRIEAGIMDFAPERERAAFVDEIHDIKTLSATPYRQYKLFIGEANGVAQWAFDLLNRIFSCNHVEINGLQYETPEGAKWEITRVKGYPLYGGAIDISEARNIYSSQIASGLITPGIVAAYDINTNLFGGPDLNNDVHIEDIEIIN